MYAQKLETLPPPPGVIGSLKAGFDVVSNHVALIIMPVMLLSGFMFPVESMPASFRWITLLNPVRHYLEITHALISNSALENIGYHQLHDIWRAVGYVDIARRTPGWGAQQRRGFVTAPAGHQADHAKGS